MSWPRQVVGCATAACVLLCHVYCACGGSPETLLASSSPSRGAVSHPGCHGHGRDGHRGAGHHRPEDQQAPKHDPSNGGDHRDSSCEHCTPAAAAQIGNGKSLSDFDPALWLVALTAPSFCTDLTSNPPVQMRVVVGDLSPPKDSCTLLRLRCALVI